MLINVEIKGQFKLTDEDLEGVTKEQLKEFIEATQEGIKRLLLDETNEEQDAHFEVKLTKA